MELLKCTQCGAIGLEDMGEYFVCPYCRSQFRKTAPQPQQSAAKRPASKRPAQKKTGAKRPAANKQTNAKPRPPKKEKPQREIVYIPPEPFNRNRLLLQLSVVAAVVIALFLSLSLFFKVDTITVGGNESYSIDTIMEASGIKRGDNLLSINDAKVSSLIITELPYVKSVRIGIKLPGTVNIEIEELDVVYAIADEGGIWWLMTSQGRVVEMTDEAGASERTKIQGVTITGAIPGLQAKAKEEVPTSTDPSGVTVTQPVTISAAQRLDVALTILQYLEHNDILGQMAYIDVSNMGSLQLQYGQRFRIKLGDTSDLRYKIELAVAAIDQLEEHDKGILDITFLDRDEVVYTPQAD